MSNENIPSEGGSGGKRGHSNMEHGHTTDEIKESSRSRRRIEDKKIIKEQLDESEKSN